ncbi:WD repeat, SAM and U-box domain-containing protein 1-like [Achroia grisella]|uniref:WD repeat, SAM and U-box domain-containing protein 1-like n=1 Tax=Achroia grisella TaxID=688607 RepID=UPI0027D20E82|nr:WD repeat, SAM and U-box domain-containing protein 1-like [Achroia grisella]
MEIISEPKLLQTLRGHRGEVTCVDAVRGRLVSGGGDKSLRLWRWAAGGGWQEAAAVRAAHRYGVTAARWSDSGALVASGGVDGALRVWSGRSLAPRRTLAAPNAAAARALCWAGGGRLAAGHDDGALCVWHVPRGDLVARLLAHQGSLQAVSIPARRSLLLTACTEGVLKVFDLIEICNSGVTGDEGPPPVPLTWVDGAHDLGVLCADATEHGYLAATGGHDSLIRLWRAVPGPEGRRPSGMEAAGVLEGHAAAVTALRWSCRAREDDEILVSSSLDRTARLWAPVSGDCLHVVHGHSRYLTCISLSDDLRYMITGSNDKSVRMWTLGKLTLDDELEPPCPTLMHFGLGDLEGIEPVDGDEPYFETDDDRIPEADGDRACRVWHDPEAHTGAINCIATHDDLLATASSDGWVKIFRWCESEAGGELVLQHALEAHRYPALAVDFGAGGALLLSAGLDGYAALWDVQMGCVLRSLCVSAAGGVGAGAGGGAGEGEAGGGGVRGARVSPQRPPQLLLASDDGLALLWSLADSDPRPSQLIHVYGGHVGAVTCCAWSCDGRVLATGSDSGELRLHAPPPAARTLHHRPHAHDQGVQSCDFSSSVSALGVPDDGDSYLLATAGGDSLIKLWVVTLEQVTAGARVRVAREFAAHGGGAASVRWAAGGALLASAGADGWARAWAVRGGAGGAGGAGGVRAAAAAPAAGPALAAAPLRALLAVGSLAGELALWRLAPARDRDRDRDRDREEGAAPRWWAAPGVERWLREYVTRPAESHAEPRGIEIRLVQKVRKAAVTGANLLDDTIEELLDKFGYGEKIDADDEQPEKEDEDEKETIRQRLIDELKWLRRGPTPPELAAAAPHALLCPLTHGVLREPARAADGLSYERAHLLEWLIAEGATSPASGRRLAHTRAAPNYALRGRLQDFLKEHAGQQ